MKPKGCPGVQRPFPILQPSLAKGAILAYNHGIMKRIAAKKLPEQLEALLDELEEDGEEVVIVRNRRRVARLVPESRAQTARAVLDDLLDHQFQIGAAALAPTRLLGLMLREALGTFVLIYVFVTPIGAVLTLRLLTHRTHTIPRILGAVALIALAKGLLR
jgi:antitoxin (DNA-binding transcriptional repressor) of toxin-antitoxin stability system